MFICTCTPLGHSVTNGITLVALALWLNRAPDAIAIPNKHGNIAVSEMRSHSNEEKAILIATRTRPKDMLCLNSDGDTPLHGVLQNHGSDLILRLLIERCPPEIFNTANKMGRLPIHEAIQHGAALGIVQLLIRRSPQGVLKTRDISGRLPVHLFTRHTSLEVADLLIRLSHPDAFSQVDDTGMLPLHSAAAAGSKYGVMSLLVTKSPDGSICKPDAKLRLPLHHALSVVQQVTRNPTPTALTKMLLGETSHEVLLKQDESGQFLSTLPFRTVPLSM